MPILGGMGMFEYQNLDWDTFTDLGIDPIVINDWYVPLVPTRNVKAHYLIIEQTNDGAAAETIEVELTVDGTVYSKSISMNSASPAYFFLTNEGVVNGSYTVLQMLSLDADQSAPLETRSLGIRVRQTSAVDATGAVIEVNMVYETKESS